MIRTLSVLGSVVGGALLAAFCAKFAEEITKFNLTDVLNLKGSVASASSYNFNIFSSTSECSEHIENLLSNLRFDTEIDNVGSFFIDINGFDTEEPKSLISNVSCLLNDGLGGGRVDVLAVFAGTNYVDVSGRRDAFSQAISNIGG